MNSISELVRNNLEARTEADNLLSEGIEICNKFSKDLHSLLIQVDNLSWQACQEDGLIGPILDIIHSKAEDLKASQEHSDPSPTPKQFKWLESQLNGLLDMLKDRGDSHISDLKDDHYKRQLKVKGGPGYTRMFLDEEWTVMDQSWSSKHPIPELKDRIKVISDTVYTLNLNQRAIAHEMEKMSEELVKIDNKVMSTIYSDGERFVKVFKKTPGWKATPQEVMVQEFSDHLGTNLKMRARPAIEPINPRSGKDPFLKVTFISDGEKREFTKLNKATPNGYEARRLTPQAAQSFEKSSKVHVVNVTAKYLYEMGFCISDKDIGSSAYPQFRPDFHLVVRLFIGGLPGFPKDKPHSFTIKLDGSDIEPQIEKEMKDHRPKDIPPRHPPAKTPTDVQGDAIEAIDKELTKDLTYVGGTRRRPAGTTNHNKSLNKSQKKTK